MRPERGFYIQPLNAHQPSSQNLQNCRPRSVDRHPQEAFPKQPMRNDSWHICWASQMSLNLVIQSPSSWLLFISLWWAGCIAFAFWCPLSLFLVHFPAHPREGCPGPAACPRPQRGCSSSSVVNFHEVTLLAAQHPHSHLPPLTSVLGCPSL